VALLLPLLATTALCWTLQRDITITREELSALRLRRAALQRQRTSLDERGARLVTELAAAQAARAAAERQLQTRPAAGPPTGAPRDLSAPEAARAVPASASSPAGGAAAAPESARAGRERPEPFGPSGNVYFPELLADADYARQFMIWQRQQTATRYAELFAALAGALAPAELARFREALAEREMAASEVDGILITRSLQEKTPLDRAEVVRTKAHVRRTCDDEIAQQFGAAVLAQLRAFEGNTGARQDLLDRLDLRLSYSAAPLQRGQAARLAEAYNASRHAALRAAPGPGSALSDAFMAAAENVLEPAQLPALRSLRDELGAARGGVSSFSVSTAARGAAPPPAK
jgi:hypothetical protein